MNHLDLFSGIGGFSLAAQWVWNKEHNIHSFIEIDPFCQKVLKKHWPNVPIISDIKEYKHDGTNIDLLTGDPPCQKTSVAAAITKNRTGKTLWPEMAKIIKFTSPIWIIIEQPSGNKKWENKVAMDLESLEYLCKRFEFKASDYSAPHSRKRVFFVANTMRKRQSKISRLRSALPAYKKPWPTPPRGAWRSTRTGDYRMDDGISDWVDRLKSLGNAIVPQVIVPIMQAIKHLNA